MAFEAFEINSNAVGKIDTDRICCIHACFRTPHSAFRTWSAVSDRLDFIAIFYDSFREQKTGGEGLVVARRSHRDGNSAVIEFAVLRKTEAYLKRFFDGEQVVEMLIDRPAVNTPDGRLRKSLTRSHDFSLAKSKC